MTRISHIICDRCKSELDTEAFVVSCRKQYARYGSEETKDICDKCNNRLNQFFNGLAVPNIESE